MTRNDRNDGANGGRGRRSRVAAAAIAVLVAALGACSGDDAGGDGDSDGGGDVELPTGADDVVLRLGDGPIPTLLIAGDGAVYELADESSAAGWSAAATAGQGSTGDRPAGDSDAAGFAGRRSVAGYAAIAPAPTGPQAMTVRHLSDEGLQRVFDRAAELGLLGRPPRYADVNVTDSGSTYLELRDADGTYEHVAYALGYDDEEIDDERQAFLDMVEDLGDLERLAGRRNLSEPEPYTPGTYVVTFDELMTPGGRSWPAGVPLEEGCVQLPLERFPDPVAGTYRYDSEGAVDRTARVWVVPDLPGDDC